MDRSAANHDERMAKLREYAEWGGADSTYRWALDEIERLREVIAEMRRDRQAWRTDLHDA